jgi:ElaB/YqjD/DUF883 family membrane-anchored ribosome-binding protein
MATPANIEPSVSALRVRAETNRVRLTETVEELRTQVTDTATDIKERLSPAAIKAEVTDYVRDSRDQLWNTLERKARDNPLHAVAVGSAIAYPAFKLLRALPAPLLLIGAGLLLSRSSAQPPQAVRNAADAVRAKAQDAMDQASTTFDDVSDKARRTIQDATDAVKGSVDSATAAVDGVRERAAAAVDHAKSSAGDTVENLKAHAGDLVQQARQTVSTTWDQNPLVVAGIGLAIGAVLAAAFPSTAAENSVFGSANDALRRTAGDVAAKGVEAAHGVIDSAAKAAADEGLSPDGLANLGTTLNDKLRAVAERGMAAAVGGPTPAAQPFAASNAVHSPNPSREQKS